MAADGTPFVNPASDEAACQFWGWTVNILRHGSVNVVVIVTAAATSTTVIYATLPIVLNLCRQFLTYDNG